MKNYIVEGIFISDESNINTSSSPLNDQSTESEKIESISKKIRQTNGKCYIKEQMQQKREIRKRKLAEKSLLKQEPQLSPQEMQTKLQELCEEQNKLPKLDPKQLKNLPPEERKKLKKQEQMMKNRISAQISRDKKKAEREQMEKTIYELNNLVQKLQQEKDNLKNQVLNQKNGLCKNCGKFLDNKIGNSQNIQNQTSQQQQLQNTTIDAQNKFHFQQGNQTSFNQNNERNESLNIQNEYKILNNQNNNNKEIKPLLFSEQCFATFEENLKLNSEISSSYNSTTNETQNKQKQQQEQTTNDFDLFDIIESENSGKNDKNKINNQPNQPDFLGIDKLKQQYQTSNNNQLNSNIQFSSSVNNNNNLKDSTHFLSNNYKNEINSAQNNDLFPTYGREPNEINFLVSEQKWESNEFQDVIDELDSQNNKNSSTQQSDLNSSLFFQDEQEVKGQKLDFDQNQNEDNQNEEYLIRSPNNTFSFPQKMFSFTLLCVCLLFVFTGNFGTNNLQGSNSNWGDSTQLFQNYIETAINQLYSNENEFQDEAIQYISQLDNTHQLNDPLKEYQEINKQINQEVDEEVLNYLKESNIFQEEIQLEENKNIEKNKDSQSQNKRDKNQIKRKQFEQSLKENTYKTENQENCPNEDQLKTKNQGNQMAPNSKFLQKQSKNQNNLPQLDYMQNPVDIIQTLQKNGDIQKIQNYIEQKYKINKNNKNTPANLLSQQQEDLKVVKMTINGKQLIRDNLLSQNQLTQLLERIKQDRVLQEYQKQKSQISPKNEDDNSNKNQIVIDKQKLNEKEVNTQNTHYEFENEFIELEMNSESDEICQNQYNSYSNYEDEDQENLEESKSNDISQQFDKKNQQQQNLLNKEQIKNKTIENLQVNDEHINLIQQDRKQQQEKKYKSDKNKQIQELNTNEEDKICQDDSILNEFENSYYQISCLITGIQKLSFEQLSFMGKYN
ncbi:hypothetical protein PPERSA_03373 [Pseudocohnilembus persalinus]|uniref:BZIP domain-containing protein n=1 Tax=Pseudocohnilembus persalinus TaxID=266149 RepID=A0A0V0R1L5_PSEPJ|nr:hypothetical protein PPERSA_03373 [Pseudocohnilembus persalinus]|eukprot:KRX08379.1 hypothetical protein PPERSA_03373 [Pseudocohnilembus persalinus]